MKRVPMIFTQPSQQYVHLGLAGQLGARRSATPKLPAFLKTSEAAFRWARKHADLDFGSENDDPSYREALYDGYRNAAEMYVMRAYDIIATGSIHVYRAIAIPTKLGLRGINFDCLGKSWSAEERGAGVYGEAPKSIRNQPTVEVILEGDVDAQWIDWAFGFVSFMHYGTDQWEISLLPDAPVLITGLAGRFRRVFDPPILGNVGTADEDWENTCPETFTPRAMSRWKLGH